MPLYEYLCSSCGHRFERIQKFSDPLVAICPHVSTTSAVVAVGALVLTLLLYSQELDRGLKDVGFVSASMTGERKRRYGL